MTPTKSRKSLITALSAITLLIACTAIIGAASAQTFNPQQPPDFGNFNGTRPDFGGTPPDFNGTGGFPGGMGPGGDFNGTMGGPGWQGGGNFTWPDASGMPNNNGDFNGQGSIQGNGTQTDYTLIIVAVVAVVAAVAVVAVVFVRRRKSGQSMATSQPVKNGDSENFGF